MKKLFAFILLVIYSCVSTGFAVSTHYCMDRKASVEMGAVHKDVCPKCGMQTSENNGCCRDEIKLVKLQQDTQLAKLLVPSLNQAVPQLPVSQHFLSPFYNFFESSGITGFQPPPLVQGETYLKNCVFRI